MRTRFLGSILILLSFTLAAVADLVVATPTTKPAVNGALTRPTVVRAEDRWAVVVGVSKYKRSEHNLLYSADDARDFAQALERYCGFQRDHIKLLCDEEATALNIRTALGQWLPKVAGDDDLVVIFFAGHGTADLDKNVVDDGMRKYLVCHDAEPNNLFATAVPVDEIGVALRRLRSEKTLVLLDCCHSGAAAVEGAGTLTRTFRNPGAASQTKMGSSYIDELSMSGRGRAVITACNPNELSYEYSDFKHGAFTYFLIEGLSGKASSGGQVDVGSLYKYLSTNLTTPEKDIFKQSPMLATTLTGEMILTGTPLTTGANNRKLSVITSPFGAEVLVDRSTTPIKTPCTVELPAGSHRLFLYKQGYLPISDEVYVNAFRDSEASYMLNVEESKGDLLVVSPAGATVKVDGKVAGEVGASGFLRMTDLPAGAHTVRVEADGFTGTERQVSLQAGQPAVERFALQKQLVGMRSATAADLVPHLREQDGRYTWETDGAEMVFVPEGSFWFGQDEDKTARPRQQQMLGAFWIDRCEVTNAQFAQFIAATTYKVAGAWTLPAKDRMRRPATNVTLADARAYALWAGKALPTEIEWEKAARGTDGRRYPYGNVYEKLWQNTRSYSFNDTLDVGMLAKGAGPYGALDMLGNVWEWCEARYSPYPGNTEPFPVVPDNAYVLRGGSYLAPALSSDLAVTMRSYQSANMSSPDAGFRCIVRITK